MQINYKQVVIWDATLIDVAFLGSEQSVPLALRGLAIGACKITTGAPTATVGQWAPSAIVQNLVSGVNYQNTGTTAAPVWSIIDNSGIDAESTFAYNADATAGPATLTAAQMVQAIWDRNGGSANRSDTTPTALAIVAVIPGAIVGSSFRFIYRNASATPGQLDTLLAGVGVTLSGNVLIAAGQTQEYIGRVTSLTAVTLYAVNQLAGAISEVITASTVNTLNVVTGATTDSPILKPVGTDTDIGLNLTPKGAGVISIQGPSTIKVGPNYIASETGANNAIVGALLDADGTAVPLTAGLEVVVKLGHTLQAGANTFNFNGGGALAINSHLNVANNIGTAYAATGVIRLLYNGAVWMDMSQ